jgi:hypothetical protein
MRLRRHDSLLAPAGAALLGLLILGCGDGLYAQDSFTPTASATPLPTVTPLPTRTPFPTPTPLAHRLDCDAIRSSGQYENRDELYWFLDNCASQPRAYVGLNRLPWAGAQLMEVYRVPTDICPSGIAHTTVDQELNGELFSYLFRTFCNPGRPLIFSQEPPQLLCPSEETLSAEKVVLDYVTDFHVTATEVFCVPDGPDLTATPTPVAPLPTAS